MRPVFDYSERLRETLAAGMTLDESFSNLRRNGASIFDCIVSVRSLQHCTIADAKRLVESSTTWSDHRNATENLLHELSEADDRNA
jgi:hypothetical protein